MAFIWDRLRFTYKFKSNNPENFDVYVQKILTEKGYSQNEILEIKIQETKFNQKFAHIIISKSIGKFNVLLILDELHRTKEVYKLQKNTPKSRIIENKSFPSIEAARDHIDKKAELYKIGIFDSYESSYYRIVKTGKDCLSNPDDFLLPGDYIVRDLNGLPNASHAGIYFGQGKVVHYDSPTKSADLILCALGNGDHQVHNAEMQNFVSNLNQEIRIVVFCFQQKFQKDKIDAAIALSKIGYGREEYNFLRNNCQHFASIVTNNRLEMIDTEILETTMTYLGLGLAAAGLIYAGYSYYCSGEKTIVEQQQQQVAGENVVGQQHPVPQKENEDQRKVKNDGH